MTKMRLLLSQIKLFAGTIPLASLLSSCKSFSLPLSYSFSSVRRIKTDNIMTTDKMRSTSEQVAALRALMKSLPGGEIDAYIVPSDDAHQSEWIAEHDARRAFISGFEGSAGTAVITKSNALLWTDGRYYLQAVNEMDENWTLMKEGLPATPDIGMWLTKNLPQGSKVGTDPMVLSYLRWERISTHLESYGLELVPIAENLVDLTWKARPEPTETKIRNLALEYTGRSVGDKLREVRQEMVANDAELVVVTALDEIAYLLNLRGSDISYNPLFFSYVIISPTELFFFVDATKLQAIAEHFKTNEVEVNILPYEDIKSSLKSLMERCAKKVWISRGSSYALTAIIPEAKRLQKLTPLTLMKAIKNETEANGMIQSHIQDGVALCQYFAWVEDKVRKGEYVDELSGSAQLEKFRSARDKFVQISFATINASGSNGSIIHYHPAPDTNRPITDKEIYLCDSGAQYLNGTTDVTRTMHFGTPTAHEIECYTRVLKGQINLGTAVFPQKLKGAFLDSLARKALWDVGLDYQHGTGHGVGMYLCVHEGPMGVSYREMPDDSGLVPNMFISNEPGYYEDGKFGIRIEDIVQIVPANIKNNFNGRGALTFNTVTLCPIQTKMVDVTLLTEKERLHLNNYHKRVLETLLPILEKEGDSFTAEWLKRETQPI